MAKQKQQSIWTVHMAWGPRKKGGWPCVTYVSADTEAEALRKARALPAQNRTPFASLPPGSQATEIKVELFRGAKD